MSDSSEGATLPRPASPSAPGHPVRVEDVVAEARRLLRWLGLAVGLEAVVCGLLVGWWLGESPWAFGAVGAGAAMGVLLLVHDLGHRLDQPPRGLNLVRNRVAAAVLWVVAAPVFPWVRALHGALRAPVLASHAVANHPDFGKRSPEAVLAVIQVRSAYVLLRNVAVALVLVAAFLWAAWVANADYGGELETLWGVTWGVTVLAVVQLVAGVVGVVQLAELRPDSIRRVRQMSWLLWPLLPFGTYAAWTTRRAFGTSP